MSKFALIYQYNPTEAGPSQGEIDEWVAYDKEVRDAGVFVYEAGYHDAEASRTVSVRDGSTIVNDGVAHPSEAVVSGLYVIDVADINAATAWAEKIPTARYGSVDIRPVVEF
ncbi:YciI family protein [Saccharopolyspora sp. NPDC002376]